MLKKTRPRHTDKDIEISIKYAIDNGWEFKKLGLGGHSHAWCKLTCVAKSRGIKMDEWCSMIIYSTPSNPKFIANKVIKYVQKCMH
ncbi:hypothetical protein A6J40_08095 [Legionella longbeachae]|nr:hypothetical protein A6J40_08095 [Legionella longbeachae]TIH05593.1 hypothetical protein DI137_01420 [Legionella pneumophila]VEB31527.1 Uncharacterised protein [Legionella pneumophila]VEE01504.1 Uncharacterised protein [Legionella oakridgensis]